MVGSHNPRWQLPLAGDDDLIVDYMEVRGRASPGGGTPEYHSCIFWPFIHMTG